VLIKKGEREERRLMESRSLLSDSRATTRERRSLRSAVRSRFRHRRMTDARFLTEGVGSSLIKRARSTRGHGRTRSNPIVRDRVAAIRRRKRRIPRLLSVALISRPSGRAQQPETKRGQPERGAEGKVGIRVARGRANARAGAAILQVRVRLTPIGLPLSVGVLWQPRVIIG